MNTLVLGATGHIGQGVVRDLLSHGYRVTAATRRKDAPSLANLHVEVVVGDMYAPGRLAQWVEGHDVVVDAAAPRPLGILSPAPPGLTGPRVSALLHTSGLIRAVRSHDARLVFVSSFTTLPRPPRYPRGPGARWRRGAYPYFGVKEAMERSLLHAAEEGLRVVLVNPSAVLGPWEDRNADSSFVRLVLSGRLPWVMRHVVNVVDVRDVAAGIRLSLESDRHSVQTPLTGHDISLDVLAQRVADLGRVPSPVPADARLMGAAALWAEGIWAFTGRPAPNSVRAVPLVADAWPMGPSDQLRALGIEPRPLERTLRDSVDWHRMRR